MGKVKLLSATDLRRRGAVMPERRPPSPRWCRFRMVRRPPLAEELCLSIPGEERGGLTFELLALRFLSTEAPDLSFTCLAVCKCCSIAKINFFKLSLWN